MADPVQVTSAYRHRILRLRLLGAGALLALWQALESPNEDEVEGFTARASPVLAGLQSATAALTVGYVGLLAGRITPDLSGLTVEQDLRHPFIGVWRELKRGATFDAALQVGADRTKALADERVILTQRLVAERLDADDRIVGWRRVPQGSTCSFCIRAATERYASAKAAGNVGHKNKGRQYCDCDVVPIVGTADPGRVINRPMLDAWTKAQGDEPPAYFDATTLDAAPRPDAPAST